MKAMTIGEVAAAYQVSARMLRYYEKMGLLTSTRREGYAYCIYELEAVQRVRQILLLRRLQLPLKQIRQMMEGSREEAVAILEKQLELFRADTSCQNHMSLVEKTAVVEWIALLPQGKHQFEGGEKNERCKGNGGKRQLCPDCIARWRPISLWGKTRRKRWAM